MRSGGDPEGSISETVTKGFYRHLGVNEGFKACLAFLICFRKQFWQTCQVGQPTLVLHKKIKCEPQSQATYVVLKFLVATFKVRKKTSKINLIIYFNTPNSNYDHSTCGQYFKNY